MPLQDLFGSLDNLAGGALSDALSKAAESTSLDETLGNALSGFQDMRMLHKVRLIKCKRV